MQSDTQSPTPFAPIAKDWSEESITYEDLTDGQKAGHAFLKAFVNSKHLNPQDFVNRFALLVGPPGVGKTALVQYFLEDFINTDDSWRSVVGSAPTNKAARILKRLMRPLKYFVPTMTIQSLLGLGVSHDGRDKKTAKLYRSKIEPFSILVLDEVSQLQGISFSELIEQMIKVNPQLKVILVGDDAQLNPVHEKFSQAFACPNVFELTQPVRQQPGPLLTYIQQTREYIKGRIPAPPEAISAANEFNSITFIHDEHTFRNAYYTVLMEAKQLGKLDDPDYLKFTAWRNVTVDTYNQLAREWVYGQEAASIPFIVGESVIACSPVYPVNSLDDQSILLAIEDESVVQGIEICRHPTYPEIEVYELSLKVRDSNRADTDSIVKAYVPTESSHGRPLFKRHLEHLADAANAQKSLWADFHAFNKSFADMRTHSAITSHRAQGSSYHTIFVHAKDIFQNKEMLEAWRSFYVAISRAKVRCYILL